MVPPNISSLQTAKNEVEKYKNDSQLSYLLSDFQWEIVDVKICEGVLILPADSEHFVSIDVIKLIHNIKPSIEASDIDIKGAVYSRYKNYFIICKAGYCASDLLFRFNE